MPLHRAANGSTNGRFELREVCAGESRPGRCSPRCSRRSSRASACRSSSITSTSSTLEVMARMHRVHLATVKRQLARARDRVSDGLRERMCARLGLTPSEFESVRLITNRDCTFRCAACCRANDATSWTRSLRLRPALKAACGDGAYPFDAMTARRSRPCGSVPRDGRRAPAAVGGLTMTGEPKLGAAWHARPAQVP